MPNIADNKIIAVVTGTRAEFGLLRPVLDALDKTPYETRLLVTGSHLVRALGHTVDEIAAAGYAVAAEIDILGDDPATPMAAAFLRAFSGFSAAFADKRPDVVLLLGDRYEIFAAALAASMHTIPVAHISGGDVTEGAKDDAFRHCITKLGYLHFSSTETYRRRVIQLGEDPSRVWNVGALGAENILSLPVIPPAVLSEDVGFNFKQRFLLVTYHPETLGERPPAEGLSALLGALDIVRMPTLFTMANADDGGDEINRRLAEYVAENPGHRLVESLGAVRYLSAMRCAAAVVGNSSSAIVETPSLRVPAVNIGDRQKGRVMGENVVNCPAEKDAIAAAIERAVSPEFRAAIRDMENPYGGERVGEKIAGHIDDFLRSGDPGTRKTFYDIPFTL